MTSIKKDYRAWLLLLSVIVIAADRITKWLASTRIELGSHVVVIAHTPARRSVCSMIRVRPRGCVGCCLFFLWWRRLLCWLLC
jgi:lipoprotein signal peptidase